MGLLMYSFKRIQIGVLVKGVKRLNKKASSIFGMIMGHANDRFEAKQLKGYEKDNIGIVIVSQDTIG